MSANNVVDFTAIMNGQTTISKTDPDESKINRLSNQLAFFIESAVLFNQLASLVSEILRRDELAIECKADNMKDMQRIDVVLNYWCSKYQEVVR